MAYSLDLRKRLIDRLQQGHSVEDTAELFQVSPATIYRWHQRPSLARTVVTQRRGKLESKALWQHVQNYPEARLIDRDKDFNVHPSAIGQALKRHRITVKKTVPLPSTQPSATTNLPSTVTSVPSATRSRCHHL